MASWQEVTLCREEMEQGLWEWAQWQAGALVFVPVPESPDLGTRPLHTEWGLDWAEDSDERLGLRDLYPDADILHTGGQITEHGTKIVCKPERRWKLYQEEMEQGLWEWARWRDEAPAIAQVLQPPATQIHPISDAVPVEDTDFGECFTRPACRDGHVPDILHLPQRINRLQRKRSF